MKKIFLTIIGLLILVNIYSQLKVEYKVTCYPAGFSVTYTNSDGGIEQRKINSTSWSVSFNKKLGDNVNLSAQAENENANIHIKIYCQENLFKQANSSGDYVVASVSGILDESVEFSPLPKKSSINLIKEPYKQTFKGTMSVYNYSPILEQPDMVNSKIIDFADTSVVVLEKINKKYYKVKSGEITGYIWSGWFIK